MAEADHLSGLASIADVAAVSALVSVGPKADLRTYSISSSAREISRKSRMPATDNHRNSGKLESYGVCSLQAYTG
jgi:hypothetical protein